MNTKENKTCLTGCRVGYETPVSVPVTFTSEGVLCASLVQISVDDYEEQDFIW